MHFCERYYLRGPSTIFIKYMNESPWPEQPVSGYWHLYSDGTRQYSLFCTDEQHIAAQNYFAILANDCKVNILNFNYLSTHFH